MSERAEFFIKERDLLAEPYQFQASGLNDIFLLNGVSETDTPYGPMVHIHNVHGLQRAIGLHIAEKPQLMTGAEFRFLRRQIELTQSDLAKRMCITDQTIANYEKGKTKLGSADPFMRALYLVHILPEQTRVGILKPMIEESAAMSRKRLPDVARISIVEGWSEAQQRAHAA
jgi:putative transcriptional regulator